MRAVLEEAEAQNRAYIPFTTDTLLRKAAGYFDYHGTSNERMKAHYLLGCVYRDLNEAPHALQCYQDAIENADTLSPNCDYQTLLAVYGQMGELYYYQNLPYEQLEALRKYHHYALIAKDTFNMLRNFELMIGPYDVLGDTNQILAIEKKAREQYEQYGYHQAAASALSATIHININRGRLDEARRQMDIFEHESGLFDEKGNICKDREGYYYIKGKYLYLTGKPDSAELYYRKLISTQWEMNAYRELLALYRDKKDIDSVYKFSRLYESAIDTLQIHQSIDAMQRMASLYNYSRFQQQAEKKEREAANIKLILVSTIAIFVLCSIIVIWQYNNYQNNQKLKLQKLVEDYGKTYTDYEHAKAEYQILKRENSELLSKKQLEIECLLSQIEQKEEMLHQLKESQRISVLTESDIVRLFKQKDTGKFGQTLPSNEEWARLTTLFSKCLPVTHGFISKGAFLSPQEFRVCMLLIIGFAAGEIAVLLDTTIQRITNIKSRINKKLFNDDRAITLNQNLKKLR